MKPSFARALVALLLAAAPASAQENLGVHLLLFGDATYQETERDVADGFSLGQAVAHLNASLSPRVSLFTEVSVRPSAADFGVSLERLIVRYDVRDWLKLSGGRYHTPISWWNVAFHHGAWLQPSIARPAPIAFGTPLMPVHFLGVLAEGRVAAGAVEVEYEAGLGNGRQADLALPGDAGDDNSSLALVGGLAFTPAGRPELEAGVHAYVDRPRDPSGRPVDERILSAHVAVEHPLELLAEYFRIHHAPDAAGLRSTDTSAWYLHVGYRLPPRLPRLLPYVRLENVDVSGEDVLFAPLGLEHEAVVAGVRWDFSPFAALKLEYRAEEVDVSDEGSSLLLNVSFVVPGLLN